MSQERDITSEEFIQGLYKHIAEMAEACIQEYGRGDIKLDYSPESMKYIELICDVASEHFQNWDENRQRWNISAIGCYVFEVARRKYGGRYFWHPQRNLPILMTGEPKFHLSMESYTRVSKRIEEGPVRNIAAWFELFEESYGSAKEGYAGNFV